MPALWGPRPERPPSSLLSNTHCFERDYSRNHTFNQLPQARKDPRAYNLEPPAAAMADAAAFDRWLAEWLVGRAVKELAAVGLVSIHCR